MVLDETTPEVLNQAELLFLALPHGESAAILQTLDAGVRIVDRGADFWLASADAWANYYGGDHAGSWTYGLPELPGKRDEIAASTRVANPGCYPTVVALALAPLAKAGLIEPTEIVVVAASGTSGAGRKSSDALLATNVMGSMSAYKVGGIHQHTPEMEQSIATAAGWDVGDVRLSLTPTLAPIPRGIVATCTARIKANADARGILAETYAGERFVTVLAEGQWPQSGSVSGTNGAQLQAAVDARTGRVTVVSVIDNLGKGAAGQALQNANLMTGYDEAAGLDVIGVAP